MQNNNSTKQRSITKTLKALLVIGVGMLAFVLNPGVLVGCGSQPTYSGYVGCPQYQPTKQDVFDAFEEVPTQYIFEHDGGVIQVDFRWLDVEMVQRSRPTSLIQTADASNAASCENYEDLRFRAEMTLTWTPANGPAQTISQDIALRSSGFYAWVTAVSPTEDHVMHSMSMGDNDLQWFSRIDREQGEEFQFTLVGWVAPRPDPFLQLPDEPAPPDPPCWLEIHDGKVKIFKPQDAPSR